MLMVESLAASSSGGVPGSEMLAPMDKNLILESESQWHLSWIFFIASSSALANAMIPESFGRLASLLSFAMSRLSFGQA